MKLALRQGAALDAAWHGKLASKAIEIRLVTDYPHAGIVIDGMLYHATSAHGLICVPLMDANWVLIELGSARDAEVLALFEKLKGTKYDWFSLLAFTIVHASDSEKLYCYEWCLWAMTGMNPGNRITVERLLIEALKITNPNGIIQFTK